jgi:hypothetical protein
MQREPWSPHYLDRSGCIIIHQITLAIVGGYGSPHGNGIDREERLAQKRDRNEVTNSRSESENKEQ